MARWLVRLGVRPLYSSMDHDARRPDVARYITQLLRTGLRWSWVHLADIAGILAAAIAGLTNSPQQLGSHLLLHAWLRFPVVRVISATLAALAAAMLLVALLTLWLTWQRLTPADLTSLTGTVATFTRNPTDQRLIITLAQNSHPFLLPAGSGPFFQERDMLQAVQPGDTLTIRVATHMLGTLRPDAVLVAHELEAGGITYLALQPVQAAQQRAIFQTGRWLALVALLLVTGWSLWVWRATHRG